tara:strand:- start:8790 stop:9011 length:222 start_codon:yes stop_codon:yes gene_type:complete
MTDFKTMQQVLKANENYKEIKIELSNGKTMIIDFYNNIIYRCNPKTGVEQTREFYFDTTRMLKLAERYIKNQA